MVTANALSRKSRPLARNWRAAVAARRSIRQFKRGRGAIEGWSTHSAAGQEQLEHLVSNKYLRFQLLTTAPVLPATSPCLSIGFPPPRPGPPT